MAGIDSPRGLIADLITPLKSNGDIDGRGLGKHLDRVMPHVKAIFLASPYMGEGRSLDPAQREELLEKTLVVVRGRIPILIWVSQDSVAGTRETLLLLKKRVEMRKYTGEIFCVDSPLYYHSNRGLPLHYDDIFTIVEEPFLLLNDPTMVKILAKPLKRNNIRTGILKELALKDRLRGLIFSGSLDRSNNYQKAVRSRTDFRIYDGDEFHFLNHPSLSGIVSRGANLAPRSWQRVTDASLKLGGDQKNYPDYVRQIWDLGEYLGNMMDIYKNNEIPLMKHILSDMGIIQSSTCTPDARGTGDDKEEVMALMKRHGDFV